MIRVQTLIAGVWILAITAAGPAQTAGGGANTELVTRVLKDLNADDSVAGTEQTKSYKILFDAYLKLTPPPFEINRAFNHNTIHPGMDVWTDVSGWAESNSTMVDAILKCKEKTIVGLPYGLEKVSEAYISAGVVADIGADGTLRNINFPYLVAVDRISAFVVAETYRLMEVGQTQRALDLSVAYVFLMRQFCDREFLEEKLHAIRHLSHALANLRDVFYVYRDKISADQFTKIAQLEIPFLRPDRSRLFMPEGDRIVSEALIKEVFDESTGMADEEKLTETFADIQSRNKPLTRFGAARRWRMIAQVHGSLDASLERLQLIYDDWWRRWRIDAYDPLLDFDTQFERTNPIRYAAVIHSLQDVEVLFEVRNQLVAEVNGTAIAAGLCAYRRTFNTYPDQTEKTYTQFVRKRSDMDPYDEQLGMFKYRFLGSRQAVYTPLGQLWIDAREGLLYSQGQNHEDNRAAEHTDDGSEADLVIWPAIKAMSREQGLLE